MSRGRIAIGRNAGNRLAAFAGDRIDGDSIEAMSSPRCAAVSGFNLHANVSIGARDRARLERLLRYAARPALALDRLLKLPDGRLAYRLKRPWSDGTTDVIFEPQDFIGKLAALVPAPRVHLTRFYGILAPAAKWRSLIVPTPIVEPHVLSSAVSLQAPEPEPGMEASPRADTAAHRMSSRRNHAWACLMMRVFKLDVLECEHCGRRLRILSAIHPPDTTRKILDCLHLPSRAPPLTPAVSPSSSDYFRLGRTRVPAP